MIHKHKHLCIFSDAKHVAFRIFVALKVYKKYSTLMTMMIIFELPFLAVNKQKFGERVFFYIFTIYWLRTLSILKININKKNKKESLQNLVHSPLLLENINLYCRI